MGIRDERRAAVETEILRVAREHLARFGAAAISLRAIARELGMVSSGIYRYVESRDELLTRLIVHAFTASATHVATAHDAVVSVDPHDLEGRWDAIAGALREWAVTNPHDFALVYGSPVPDYTAPAERTSGPGTAVLGLLTGLLDDAHRAGRVPALTGTRARLAAAAVGTFVDDDFFTGTTLDGATLARGLSAWTLLLGAVTSEVFQQLGPDADTTALFAWHSGLARDLVLIPRQ
jgi:AcrR family transcriptional regulator